MNLLEINNLSKKFPVEGSLFRTGGFVEAVKDISFSIADGEIVALVGESGSGKTTVGKMIQGLLPPTSGEIFLSGEPAEKMERKNRSRFVQMIFQDPFSSLNPKLSIGTMLREALVQSKEQSAKSSTPTLPVTKGEITEGDAQLNKLLQSVGLPTNILNDYPHQFSGGQRQRLVIARALAMQTKLIIADEPVSSLDVSIQAQILNLLLDLKNEFGIAYLLIAHDLTMVRKVADRVLVMKNGKIVENGTTEKIFQNPSDSYTQSLISAMQSVTI